MQYSDITRLFREHTDEEIMNTVNEDLIETMHYMCYDTESRYRDIRECIESIRLFTETFKGQVPYSHDNLQAQFLNTPMQDLMKISKRTLSEMYIFEYGNKPRSAMTKEDIVNVLRHRFHTFVRAEAFRQLRENRERVK